MPSTRSERSQERQEITTDVFGVILGLLRKLIKFDPEVQTYVSIAGDDTAEMRRTIGLFAVQRERSIDLKISKAKQNIVSCHFYALSAIVSEERDIWYENTKVHAERIRRLEVEKISIKRILAMELPWPTLIRTALGVAATTGNTQLMDSSTYGAIADAITQSGSSPAPAPASTPPALPAPEGTTETPPGTSKDEVAKDEGSEAPGDKK